MSTLDQAFIRAYAKDRQGAVEANATTGNEAVNAASPVAANPNMVTGVNVPVRAQSQDETARWYRIDASQGPSSPNLVPAAPAHINPVRPVNNMGSNTSNAAGSGGSYTIAYPSTPIVAEPIHPELLSGEGVPTIIDSSVGNRAGNNRAGNNQAGQTPNVAAVTSRHTAHRLPPYPHAQDPNAIDTTRPTAAASQAMPAGRRTLANYLARQSTETTGTVAPAEGNPSVVNPPHIKTSSAAPASTFRDANESGSDSTSGQVSAVHTTRSGSGKIQRIEVPQNVVPAPHFRPANTVQAKSTQSPVVPQAPAAPEIPQQVIAQPVAAQPVAAQPVIAPKVDAPVVAKGLVQPPLVSEYHAVDYVDWMQSVGAAASVSSVVHVWSPADLVQAEPKVIEVAAAVVQPVAKLPSAKLPAEKLPAEKLPAAKLPAEKLPAPSKGVTKEIAPAKSEQLKPVASALVAGKPDAESALLLRQEKILKQRTPDSFISREKVSEQSVADQKALEQKIAEQKIAEQKLAEQKLAEQKLAEKKLAELKLVEQKLAEKKPVKFSAVWEVDRLLWPDVCQRLYQQQHVAFEEIGNHLLQSSRDGLRVLAVTSPTRGEGRSTIAVCMARCAAQKGLKVALVDGDLDHPSLSDHLNLEISRGWRDVLLGHLPLEEVAVHSIEDNLTLIPLTGPITPGEMLPTDVRIANMLDRLSQSFDLVVVDVAHVNSVGGLLLGTGVKNRLDATIIVTDIRNQDKARIDASVRRIRQMGVTAVGIVENFVGNT